MKTEKIQQKSWEFRLRGLSILKRGFHGNIKVNDRNEVKTGITYERPSPDGHILGGFSALIAKLYYVTHDKISFDCLPHLSRSMFLIPFDWAWTKAYCVAGLHVLRGTAGKLRFHLVVVHFPLKRVSVEASLYHLHKGVSLSIHSRHWQILFFAGAAYVVCKSAVIIEVVTVHTDVQLVVCLEHFLQVISQLCETRSVFWIRRPAGHHELVAVGRSQTNNSKDYASPRRAYPGIWCQVSCVWWENWCET